jgi:hypothetical protein
MKIIFLLGERYWIPGPEIKRLENLTGYQHLATLSHASHEFLCTACLHD